MDITVASRDVKINLSAQEWQLYTSMEGAEEAAQRINCAAEEAMRTNDRDAAETAIFAAMRKERSFGATDSEPIHVLWHLLDKVYGKEDD